MNKRTHVQNESMQRTRTSEVLISVAQANHFAALVAQGKFHSMDDAVAQSAEELQLVEVGNETFSTEAVERLREGIRQADRGELISAEEVDRKFGEFFGRLNARKTDDPRG